MCGVSPENYSQMELTNDEEEEVDNQNQNQNLSSRTSLGKHTLRNQVCECFLRHRRENSHFYEIHNSYY